MQPSYVHSVDVGEGPLCIGRLQSYGSPTERSAPQTTCPVQKPMGLPQVRWKRGVLPMLLDRPQTALEDEDGEDDGDLQSWVVLHGLPPERTQT